MRLIHGFLIAASLTLTACTATRQPLSLQPEAKLVKLGDPGLSRDVEMALAKAGANRGELQQALRQAGKAERREAMAFLIAYMPESDLKTLTSAFLLDNLAAAETARQRFPWAKAVPRDVFLNDVLPYATVTERRDAWRADYLRRFGKIVENCKTGEEAVLAINAKIIAELGVTYKAQVRRPDQGPLESMELKHASCTGLSILAIDACRAVGIPARMAGIPSWSHRFGNHNWLEVWIDGQWRMTEHNMGGFDGGWVFGSIALADTANPAHRIYASSWKPTGRHYPLIWNIRDQFSLQPPAPQPNSYIISVKNDNGQSGWILMSWNPQEMTVPGLDVTERYQQILAALAAMQKNQAAADTQTLFLSFVKNRSQVARPVRILKSANEVVAGKTNDASHDLNDLARFALPKNADLILEYRNDKGGLVRHPLRTGTTPIQVLTIPE
jgi:hypothetical protein